MSRPPTRRAFKPTLEALEERMVPTDLLDSLQSVLNDLNVASNAFLVDQGVLQGYQPAAPTGGAAQVSAQYGRTLGDYQRMINDQFTIQTNGPADIAKINFFALATGNPDVIGLVVFGLDPKFQSIINQANAAISNASAQANQTYNFIGTLGVQPSIASQVTTP